MTSKKLYFIQIGIIVLICVGLISGAYSANNLLAKQAGELTALKAKSLALTQEQTSLNKSKKDIKKYSDLEKITKAIVPEDKNQAEAVREIVNIAAANDVQLSTINFPASTLGASLPATTGGSSAATTAPSPVVSNPKTGSLSQLLPVKNIPGVYQLVITVNGDPAQPVRYDKFIDFLSALEHNRRTAQVNTITLQPDTKNHNLLSFTLTLNEYIKP